MQLNVTSFCETLPLAMPHVVGLLFYQTESTAYGVPVDTFSYKSAAAVVQKEP